MTEDRDLASRPAQVPASSSDAALAGPGAQRATLTPVVPPRLSPADLRAHHRCPKQLALKHSGAPRSERPSAHLATGNAVHDALAKFFGLPIEDRSLEILHLALRHVWPRHRAAGAFRSRDEEAAHGHSALTMLATFAESFDLSVVPVAREQWASALLPSGVELFGKVDRIDRSPDGESVRITDYKTGTRAIDPNDLADDIAAQVYLLAVESELRRPVDMLRFLYLPLGSTGEICWAPEREDVEAITNRLSDLTAEIVSTREFPADPGRHCAWCAWRFSCEDRDRVALEDLEPSEQLPF